MDPAELALLADVLLPGSARYPAASTVGVHGVMADRLRKLGGTALLEALADAMAGSGGPLGPLDRSARQQVVARLEADHPDLFGHVRLAAYTAYYESPAVVAAVRASGIAYNDAPQPNGYAMAPFDPANPQDAPTHRRGGYVATGAVRRVDLSTLPEDPLAPEIVDQNLGVATGRGNLSSGTRKDAGGRP